MTNSTSGPAEISLRASVDTPVDHWQDTDPADVLVITSRVITVLAFMNSYSIQGQIP